jgi:hypothetical protein
MAAAASECPGEISYIKWSSTYDCHDMIAALLYLPLAPAQNHSNRENLHQNHPKFNTNPPIAANRHTFIPTLPQPDADHPS